MTSLTAWLAFPPFGSVPGPGGRGVVEILAIVALPIWRRHRRFPISRSSERVDEGVGLTLFVSRSGRLTILIVVPANARRPPLGGAL
jgi:hypothetical protein